MTERLFDFDGYVFDFEARVISSAEKDGKYEIILDRTAFSPEGGGQLSDIGKIGESEISSVSAVDGEIVHFGDKPVAVGSTVKCSIDTKRRIRHLQNHSGEHIVSGLVYKKYGYNNVGFHLGHEDVTFDFDGNIDMAALREIEREANEIVVRNVAVKAYYPDADELENIFYRSKLDLKERVRVVEIDGVDACACCAPHVRMTGEVGVIKLISCHRYKGGTRIHMKCGFDAIAEANSEYDRTVEISNLISLPRDRIVWGVRKLMEDINGLKGEIYLLKKQIIEMKINQTISKDGFALFIEEKMEMQELRTLVAGAIEKCEKGCLAFSRNEEGDYTFVIGYRSEDFSEFTRKVMTRLSATGGGKAPFIQGKAKCCLDDIKACLD